MSRTDKEIEDQGLDLNIKQEAFCKLYVEGDKDFFGNGVQCYIEVYEPDTSKPNWYKSVCASSSRLLSNAKVYTRINELLEEGGLNDQFVDKQLLFLLQQHQDLGSKMAAIKEYNKIKNRIINKMELTGKDGGPIDNKVTVEIVSNVKNTVDNID